MKIYEKINKAIDLIKKSDLKKAGFNDYSKYYYFTPEQVDKLVYDSCKELKLFIKFDLIRNEYGIDGQLTVFDLETGDSVQYLMASAIPEIKATNISQQLGGAATYSKRYLLMNVFNIVDNNLDFDTPQKTQQKNQQKNQQKARQEPKTEITNWLTDEQFKKTIDSDLESIKNVLKLYNGQKGYGMKKVYREQLTKIINDAK